MYGCFLTYMLMSLTIVCVSLFVGILTRRVAETVICLFCFSILRRLTGGRHMKTVSRCVVFSSVLMIMLAHPPVRDETVILAMNLFGIISGICRHILFRYSIFILVIRIIIVLQCNRTRTS
jgi:Accessory gene regulator B.